MKSPSAYVWNATGQLKCRTANDGGQEEMRLSAAVCTANIADAADGEWALIAPFGDHEQRQLFRAKKSASSLSYQPTISHRTSSPAGVPFSLSRGQSLARSTHRFCRTNESLNFEYA